MVAQAICRRLGARDAALYQALRMEGFRRETRAFRFAPEDEAAMPNDEAAARLERDYVVGAYDENRLIGIGGLSCFTGAKTGHRALLYGMYVDADYRGAGAADAIMRALLDEARARVEIVVLTVVSENARALRFYTRWGFRPYGVDKCAAKIAEGNYLDETLMALDLRAM
ncbi:GNAT family N-acetyltransferase [Methylocystis parvus]|uniref:GNAT family N-acetyltransferase n=3 Tax=Methylocystis parvus TaxID=134 RepID=A0A6B8M2G7_9HYPH|nr:GNAT family N-acetyltransferase [Methylocystis parvus]